MIKAAIFIVLGGIAALQAERWLGDLKERISPRAVTDSMLDRANRRLERERQGL